MSRDRRRYFLPRLLKKCGRRSRVMVLNKRDIKRGATPSISSRRSSFYGFSGGGSGERNEDWTKLKSAAAAMRWEPRDSSAHIDFQERQIAGSERSDRPATAAQCRPWGTGRRYNGQEGCTPVHLRPTRPMAVDFADDRRMRHFRKPFTSNFCCNKISPTSKQSDVTHFKNKITLFYKNTFHKELLSIIIPGSY